MKNKIHPQVLVLMALMVSAVHSIAVPARPEPFPFRQPDGTEIMLRVRGDEWFHWYETPEGRPAQLDEASGYWVYSLPGEPNNKGLKLSRVGLDQPPTDPWQPQPTSAQKLVLTGQQNAAATPAALSVGTGFIPVLLGNFSNTVPVIPAGTFSNVLFSTSPGARSMATYFSQNSYGRFTVSPGPSGIQNWVTVPRGTTYYAPSTNQNLGTPAARFVRDVVLAAIAAGYNFAPYDQDGDGKVDVVNIIHAGRGQESGGGPYTIWSHRSSLTDQGLQAITNGSVIINDYVIQPELGGDNQASTIGVFVHEHGHALGLPDLYDTDYSSLGVGNWSGMSFGENNGLVRGGDCPALYDAWCKAKLGWVNPINYTLNYQNVQFPAASTNSFVAKLWKDGVIGQQYFLVENRYTNGFDAALPASGLLIWHIDESKVKQSNTQEWYPISPNGVPPRTNSGNYLVALMQADNFWQLGITNTNPSLPVQFQRNSGDAGDPFPGSANNRLFGPTTAPNSFAYNVGNIPGYNSYVAVSNISDAGPVMTADLYTRSPNSGPIVNWVNIAGVVPPFSGATFTKLDAGHPVVISALPGASGSALTLATLFLTRAADGLWWNFSSHQWETNVTGRDVSLTGAQQNGFTLGFQSDLPAGTNLVNGGHTFIVRVINAATIVTEIQMAMTVAHAPEVALSLADNSVVNTLTNFTAVATEDSGLGIQRVEIALYYDSAATEGGEPTRWYWDGYAWTTTVMWLGADFAGHPAQATLYYPIGPDANALLTEKEYTIAARAVDALGDATTNQIAVFYDAGTPATIYWRYGASGNWFDPYNWTPARVPDASDHAVVNAPGDYTVTVNGNASVASLRFGRVVGLDRQNLVIPSGVSLTTGSGDTNRIYGRATLDLAGTFTPGKLHLSGGALWNWTNGVAGGYWRLRPGAALNLSGAATKQLGSGAVLDNYGLINWAGPGLIYNYGYQLYDRAVISNQPNAVFNLNTDGQVFTHDYYESLFYNLPGGQIVKSAGVNSNTFNNFTLFNSGEVRVLNGEIRIDGTCLFDTGTSLTGNGIVRLLGSSAINCPVPGTANLRLEAGTLTATGPAAYAGSAGMDWTGGTLAGAFEVAPGSTLRISGAATKTLGSGAVLNNRGEATWTGPGVIYNYGYQFYDRATINNRSNATFTVLTDGQLFAHEYNSSWFNNEVGALFRKTAGSGAAVVNNFIFNNTAEVNVSSGTLEFNDALNLGGGGRLTGSGQFLISGGLTTLSNLTTIDAAAVTLTNATFFGEPSASATLATVNGGSFNWAGGLQNGTVNIAPSTTFHISGAAQKNLGSGAILNNSGNLTWSGSGNIYNYGYQLYDRATINNLAGATFNVTSNAAFTFDYNPSFINNASNATFAKIGGDGVTTCNWLFNNAGTASAANGALALSAGGNSSGSFAATPGAFLRFTGGTHSLANGVSFGGAGRIQIDGGTLLLNGALTLGSPVQPLTWDLISGTLGGSGTWLGSFTGTWTGGTIAGTQTITAGGALVVTNLGPKSLGSGAMLNNQGAITWFGPGPIYNYGYQNYDTATINNQSNAVFNVAADGQLFTHEYNPSTFNNLPGARFAKIAGAGTTAINNFLFNSTGEIRAETGSLLFDYIVTLGPDAALTGGGSVRLAANATLVGTLNSMANFQLEGGALTGQSNATYTGSGPFSWTNGTLGGNVTLASGSTLNLTGAATKTLGSGAILNNQGTINWSGPGTIYNYGYQAYDVATVNNESGGKFILDSDGQVFSHDYNMSTFNNLPGAQFKKLAGTNSAAINNFIFNSPGEVRVEAGSLLFDSVATFGPGGQLAGAGPVRWVGDIRISGAISSGATVQWEGGTLTGQSNANYNGSGPLNWTAGTLAGTLTLSPGTTANLSGAAAKGLGSGAILNNAGTLNWSGPGAFYNYGYQLSDRATVNNLSGGVFNLNTDGAAFSYDYYPSFLNNAAGAKLRKTAGLGSAGINYNFTNNGAIEIQIGTLDFTGTYAANASTAEMNFTLGGITPGAQFGRLTANGNLPLDGKLQATLAGGFTPTNGQSFAIVGYGSHTGQFSSQQLPPLSPGLSWLVDYGPNAVTLHVQQSTATQSVTHLVKNPGGSFQFDFTGPTGSRCVILASTNLADWMPLLTNEPFNGNLHFDDPAAAGLPKRFYQVRIEP